MTGNLGGPMMGGPSANQANASAGLPFAGVPSELRDAAERIAATEPEHPDPVVEHDPSAEPGPLGVRVLLAPERTRVVVALVLVAIETVAGLAGPLLTAVAIDQGVTQGDLGVVVAVAGIYVVTVVVQAVTATARLALTARIAERVLEQLRVRLFTHLQRLSVDFFTRERTGVVLSRMTSDVDALAALLTDGYLNLVVQGLTVVIVTAVLIGLSPLLAALLLLVVVPVLVGLTWWFRGASAVAYARVRDRIAEVLADLSEHLAGIRVVITSGRAEHNTGQHRRIADDYEQASVTGARINAVYGPAAETTGLLAQAMVVAVGGALVLDGRLSLGELTAFVLYLTTFFAPIQQLVTLYNVYQQGQAAITKLNGLLAERSQTPEAEGAVDLGDVEGDVELCGVTFAYADVDVLCDVDLHVEAGETLALVGRTGAGKSTIASLVARFADVDRGSVRIDGVDVRSVTLGSLRRQLGVVPQEPFLFHGSLRDNLAFARPDADDVEILAACDAVGLGDLVERHDAGLDAEVHERGVTLSAGERQLLALARALLARPRILILDEATSSLDLGSERRVERALDAVRMGRTTLLIAHRMATAMRADRIAVIDDGRIVELGTHHELMALGGHYAGAVDAWVAAGGASR